MTSRTKRRLVAAAVVLPVAIGGVLVAQAADPVASFTVKADADDTWQSVAVEYGYTGTGSGTDASVSTAGDKLQRFNRVGVSTSDSSLIGAGAGVSVEGVRPSTTSVTTAPPSSATAPPSSATSTTASAPSTTATSSTSTSTAAPTTTAATTTTTPSTTTPSAPTPTTTMPPGHMMPGLHVDAGSLVRDPNGNSAFTTNRLIPQTNSPSPESTGWNGIVHVECRLSHFNWDDPIVFPGVANATHLHAFYGATDVDHTFTATRRPGASSTCTGGMANGSAYWAPAMIDLTTDRVVVSDYLQIYYRSGYQTFDQFTPVEDFPAQLRMIAGRTMSDSGPAPAGFDKHPVFSCQGAPVASEGGAQTIPNCAPGQWLTMGIKFPQCWNGALDSPDHRSHMAYAVAGLAPNGCPSSHPRRLPEIIQFYIFPVGPSGTANWALSSDVYTNGDPNAPAGFTAHADWWNGWDPAISSRIARNCWNGRIGNSRVDCHVNLIGPPSGPPNGPGGQELQVTPGVP